VFFNVRGIVITLAAIAAVALLCMLDVHCSNVRDRRAKEQPSPGVVSRVKGELAAGAKEFAQLRADQLNAQLRDLRILAKHFVEKGENRRARATIALIQELEAQAKSQVDR